MDQGNGFVGVICLVYLIGGFGLGGLALALQMVTSQFAKKPWVRMLPLTVGVLLWTAMIYYRFVGIGGGLGGVIGGLYTAFGGWVHPHDLVAFAMSTVPIIAGLVIGYWVANQNKIDA